MSGTAHLARLEEHLGKRKPEGAAALLEGRSRAQAFAALARAFGEGLDLAAGARSEQQLTAAALAQVLDAIALVDPVIGAAAEALCALAPAGVRPPHPAVRVCTSLHPDAARAALAGTAADSTALFTPAGDLERAGLPGAGSRAWGLAFPQGPREELPTVGEVRSVFAPEALRIAALRGIDTAPLLVRAAEACEALLAAPPEENEALRLGALLSGLAARGAWNVTLSVAPSLAPLGLWIETLAALSPAGRLQVAAGEPLADPAAYGSDRLFVELRDLGSASDPRVRRLNAAGLPTLLLAVPAEGWVEELVRWELALAFACGAPWLEERGPGSAGDFEHEHEHEGAEPWLAEPALREGPLAITCEPAHAHVLRKVAGTLGPKAATSVPHWLAAQLALQEPGDLASLHFTALPTRSLREALPGLQRALRDATRLASRAVFGLGTLGAGATTCAGGAAAGLYLLLSDVGPEVAGAGARRDEEQALSRLVAEGRRALLLRAEDGDSGKLVAALHQAASLLKG